MTPNFFAKGTLLVPSGTLVDPGRMHLHVICTDPDATGRQIFVSISTFWEGCDPTCVLQRHEHDWLWKERSFVDYRYTHLRAHGQLVERVREQVFVPMADMNGQAFLKVCRGIERSPFTPRPMKDHYRRVATAKRQAHEDVTGATPPAIVDCRSQRGYPADVTGEEPADRG